MKIGFEEHGPITVLTLDGALNGDHVDTWRRCCEERLSAGMRQAVVDLGALTGVDSAGLEALLWLADELDRAKGKLKIVNPDETVSRILLVTRLNRRFEIHGTIEAAAKSLR